MALISKKDITEAYNETMDGKEPTDLCVFFHAKEMAFSVMNKDELNEQMKSWRKQAKGKTVKMRKANNKTKTYDGKEWHILVVQPYDDEKLAHYNPDPFSLLLLGFYVNGYVYAFDNIKNRDMIYEYVMKGL